MSWKIERSLNNENLRKLVNGEVACIVIDDFASEGECHKFVDEVERVGYDANPHSLRGCDKIGPTVYNGQYTDPSVYFAHACESKVKLKKIFEHSFDPLARLKDLFLSSTSLTLEPAVDEQYGEYYVGVIRNMLGGVGIHSDYSPYDSRDFSISDIHDQFAWNLYLSKPKSGGQCIIYKHKWVENHEVDIKTYRFNTSFLDSTVASVIHVEKGSLCIFNPRYFHEVSPSIHTRLSIGSFGGMNKGSDTMMLWS